MIFTLGDIHGRYKALQQVFERSNFNFKEDQLIFLGDVVDRGPEPFKCIDFLLNVPNRILISGNHDLNFQVYIHNHIDYLDGEHGVSITKELWQDITLDQQRRVFQFFKEQIPYHVDNKNRFYTHGGFDRWDFVANQDDSMFAWDRKLWRQALSCKGDQKLVSVDNFEKIFIGHTPLTRAGRTTPQLSGGVWNLDTGAGFDKGKLTMMNVETEEFFQSDLIGDIKE